MSRRTIKTWFNSGDPWVWMTAAAVSISVIMVAGLLLLIGVRGLSYFWPADIHQIEYRDDQGRIATVIGEIYDEEQVPAARLRDAGISLPPDQELATRYLIKIGNRELHGLDFRWLLADHMVSDTLPAEVFVAERREWGNFYGYLVGVKQGGRLVDGDAWQALAPRLERARALQDEISRLEKKEIGAINYQLERLRLQRRKLELAGEDTPDKLAEIEVERQQLQQHYQDLQARLNQLYGDIKRDSLVARVADGSEHELPLASIVAVHRPNALSWWQKSGLYLDNLWQFVSGEPREANTEGGIFPAIFGTVMMVIIMSIFVTPFGVVAAVYLREYARQGVLTRLIRIAVNNLAGVPSIVYGVFGLGFFVYFLGGNIDRLFFPEAMPAPTFGTPGILWASLTLAILTLPVVIVATEEGLARIPRNIREGSLALGATKWETLWRTVIPMASPSIMTGLILAVARAAGEVAPLMLVGVVKLAPSLPLDGNFPYLHLDRKFMHLGFHIYDVGFQSPNVEAARPLVYATALLLVVVIILLNVTAIMIRNRLREKYKSLDQ